MPTYRLSFNITNTAASKQRAANALSAVLHHIAGAPWSGFADRVGVTSIVIDPGATDRVTVTTDRSIPANQLTHLELEEVV